MPKRYKDFKLRIVKMPPPGPGMEASACMQIVEAPDHETTSVSIYLQPDAPTLRKIALLGTEGNELTDFGHAFFQQLFEPHHVRPLYNRVRGIIDQDPDVGLRIQVIPQNMASAEVDPSQDSFQHMPWEYLYDPDQQRFLALDPDRVSLVRSSPNAGRCRQIPTRPPVRVLTVLANPRVGAKYRIDVGRERQLIEQAVEQAGLTAVIGLPDNRDDQVSGVEVIITHLDQLPDAQGQPQKASRVALKRYFRDRPRPHILYVSCHGSYDDTTREGVLVLEKNPQSGNEQGQQDKLAARELQNWLTDLAPHLRLVIFNACSTAPTREVAAFKSIAEAAVQAGVPAVIAMQFDIPLDVAQVFTLGFCTQLFKACLKEGRPIDLALARAREEILAYAPLYKPHWGIPVLYRHPSGLEPFQMAPPGQWERARNLMDELFFNRQQRKSLLMLRDSGSGFPSLSEDLARIEQNIERLEGELKVIFEGS